MNRNFPVKDGQKYRLEFQSHECWRNNIYIIKEDNILREVRD